MACQRDQVEEQREMERQGRTETATPAREPAVCGVRETRACDCGEACGSHCTCKRQARVVLEGEQSPVALPRVPLKEDGPGRLT